MLVLREFKFEHIYLDTQRRNVYLRPTRNSTGPDNHIFLLANKLESPQREGQTCFQADYVFIKLGCCTFAHPLVIALFGRILFLIKFGIGTQLMADPTWQTFTGYVLSWSSKFSSILPCTNNHFPLKLAMILHLPNSACKSSSI